MKVLVCGGRDYNSLALSYKELDKLDPRPSHIISGHSRGAETMITLAESADVPVIRVNL